MRSCEADDADGKRISIQSNSAERRKEGFDLLRLRPVRVLLLWAGFPYVFQALLLAVFVGLGLYGWGRFPPEGVNGKLYAKCNVVNLLIWAVWWPVMVWLAVLLGRAWCMVCPLELVSNVGERIGRRLGLPQRPLWNWATSGALIVVLYALIQFLVAGVHLHRVPHYTSLFLFALLGLSAVSALVLKDRAFCRGFCPVGLLLGTYGRGGMLAIRAAGGEICQACTGNDCVAAGSRTNLDARSCPSLLNPPKLSSNRDCLVCGQCIKVCQTDNMRLFLRRPFHENDKREPLASWPVTLFVMLVSGFIAYELCSEWAVAKHWFGIVPHWFAQQFGQHAIDGWIKGAWMLIVVPLAAWTILGTLVWSLGGAANLGVAWRRLALPMAVIIAAAHMAKSLAKLVSWGGFLPLALDNPSGVDSAIALSQGAISTPPALLAKSVVSMVGVILLVAALLLALREARLANPDRRFVPMAVPLVLLATTFTALVLGWQA